MSNGTCAIEGCGRPVKRADLCTTHYGRYLRTGVRGGEIKDYTHNPLICIIDGCESAAKNRAWCSGHYQKWARYGDPKGRFVPERELTCEFPDCGKPRRYQGLCMGHYCQRLRGSKIGPLKVLTDPMMRDADGCKQCRRCAQWLSESEFFVNNARPDNLGAYCRQCESDKGMITQFGIGVVEYEAMLASQGGGCAICGKPPEGDRRLCIDHDHACCPTKLKTCGKCVRALLCLPCNAGLGQFYDDPDLLLAAGAYLISHRRDASAVSV